MLVHAFHERVIVDFTEALSKGDLLLGREGLVAEKDHKVLEPGGLYLSERFIIQRAQVDVGDFSAERSCDRLDSIRRLDATVLRLFRPEHCKTQANRSTAHHSSRPSMLMLSSRGPPLKGDLRWAREARPMVFARAIRINRAGLRLSANCGVCTKAW